MNTLKVQGVVATVVLHAVAGYAFVGLSGLGDGRAATLTDPTEMEAIEARLAFKPKTVKKKTRQPQKARVEKAAPEVQKISRDADAPPPPPKQEKKKVVPRPTAEEVPDWTQFRRPVADDLEAVDLDETAAEVSATFDGSEHGFAEDSAGHPYMQKLAADAHNAWAVPALERAAGDAIGCVRLLSDGTIESTKLHQSSSNSTIDRSVQVALDALQSDRATEPTPVPSDLSQITTRWICFNFQKAEE